jgi:hypothetical protein
MQRGQYTRETLTLIHPPPIKHPNPKPGTAIEAAIAIDYDLPSLF